MQNAESAVKKLARLPGNCICANCGTESKYGFSTVCIKYYTFVCNLCKTAHQAVSHRCKSLTMSSWDQGEVLKLMKNGNVVAGKTWLAAAPPIGQGGRPKEGDDVNVFKRFVVATYDGKRYYREAGGVRADAAPSPRPTAAPSQPQSVRHRAIAPSQPKPAPKPKPVPAPAPAVDLLDFGAFDSAPTLAPVPTAPVSRSTDPEPDDFADFGAPSPAPTNPAPDDDFGDFSAPDDFGDFSQAQPVSSAQPNFDPFNNNTSGSSHSMPTQASPMIDPFAPSSTSNAAPAMTNDLFSQPAPATFDPFNNNAAFQNGNLNSNSNANGAQQHRKPAMNSMNIMAGGGSSSGNSTSNMMGNMNMGNGGMTPGAAMNGNQNMGNGNNNMMMNNGMMQNQGTTNQQQQMMMMNQQMNMMKMQQQQQQQQPQNNFGMMGKQPVNNNSMNNGMGMGMGMQSNNNTMGNSNGMNAMNVNIMQPNNNSISNSFGANAAPAPVKKNDPFSGLGF